MIPEIYKFDKSVQQRLNEYLLFFDKSEYSNSQIDAAWSDVLEQALEPCGWNALWCVSRNGCNKFNLLYPTSVLVYVEDTDFQELASTVKIVALQEDILLPETISVSLMDLYPTKLQTNNHLSVPETADWLHRYRFFFKYLWFPWDEKNCSNLHEWCTTHLNARLKLVLGNTPYKNIVHLLIAEASNIRDEIDDSAEEMNEEEKGFLINKLIRMKQLETELYLFEDPELRNSLLTKYSSKSNVHVVWSGSLNQLSNFLQSIDDHSDVMHESVVFSKSLEDALKHALINHVIVLTPGIHEMVSLGLMSMGGCIKGLKDPSVTVIQSNSNKAIFFNCFGSIVFENLTIKRAIGTAVVINSKEVVLCNCIVLSENLVSNRGIVIKPNCKLILRSCKLIGYATALLMLENSELIMKDCQILNCKHGIKTTNGCKITLDGVQFIEVSEYCIHATTCVDSLENSGNEELISSLADINIKMSTSGISYENCSTPAIKISYNKL